MKIKLNKKIILGATTIPLTIATPIAVAVSCGATSNATNSQKNISEFPDKKLSQYSAIPYSDKAIKSFYSTFTSILKFSEKLKGDLKIQAIKVFDSALVAIGSYLYENDASNANSKDADHIKKIKIAKANFAQNLKKLKIQVDLLFDKIATGDDETLLEELLGGLFDKNETNPAEPTKTTEKPKPKVKTPVKSNPLVSIAKLAFGKIKFVLDNVIDTMINIEKPTVPKWKTDKDVKKIGTYKELSLSVKNTKKTKKDKDKKPATPTAGINATSDSYKASVKKTVDEFINGDELKKEVGKNVIRSFKADAINLLDYSDIDFFTMSLAEGMVKSIDQPAITIQNNGYKAGLKMFKDIAKNSPEKLVIYKNSKTGNIYFEIDDSTSNFASTIRKTIKYNEENIGGLINDALLNDVVLGPLIKNGEITIPETTDLLAILGNPSAISGLLSKIESMLEDFGKAIQLTELDLQMFISNLTGNQAQYYGQLTFDKTTKNYKMKKEEFISPQFKAFDIQNYSSNNEKVKKDVKDKKIISPHIKKSINIVVTNINIDIPIFDLVDKLTGDPYSNYTFSIMELLAAMKLKNIEV